MAPRFGLQPFAMLAVATLVMGMLLASSGAEAWAGPQSIILLYAGSVFTTLSPDGVLCLQDREGSWNHPIVQGTMVDGPIDFLATPDATYPDGRSVYKVGTRTVILEMLSSVALVDGRSVALWHYINDIIVPWGPLEQLAPLLGYRLLFGVTPPPIITPEMWVMRPSPRVLIEGEGHTVPRPLGAKVEAGQPIVPVVVVAAKLGCRAWNVRAGGIVRLSRR